MFKISWLLLLTVLLATSIFPLHFGKINAPDKTELKKITPYLQSLTKNNTSVSVFRMNYWGAVADFAFYVDRPVKSFETEESFSSSMEKGKVCGYIKKEDYKNLSENFKKTFPPLFETENFYLITSQKNHKRVKKRMLPLFIY